MTWIWQNWDAEERDAKIVELAHGGEPFDESPNNQTTCWAEFVCNWLYHWGGKWQSGESPDRSLARRLAGSLHKRERYIEDLEYKLKLAEGMVDEWRRVALSEIRKARPEPPRTPWSNF